MQAQAQPAFCGLPRCWSRGRLKALEPAVSSSLSLALHVRRRRRPALHLPPSPRPGPPPQRIPATGPHLHSCRPGVRAAQLGPRRKRSRAPLPPGKPGPRCHPSLASSCPPHFFGAPRTPAAPGASQPQEALLHLIQVGSTAPSSASPRASLPTPAPQEPEGDAAAQSFRVDASAPQDVLEEGLGPPVQERKRQAPPLATGGSLAWGHWEPAGGGERLP